MTDETSTTKGLGYFDPERLASDYELTETYFEVDQPFDILEVVTNDFIDPSIVVPTD